jgi:MerR family transcriptional regulator, copper efflux regulator
MHIGAVAEQSGVPTKTIRYYESIGLIQRARRTVAGYRVYGQHDIQTLRFIQRARGLGFSVQDVAGLLALWQDTDRASAQVKALAEDHRARIDRKIEELRGLRATLDHLIVRCHGDDRPDCPILDDLAGESRNPAPLDG